MKLSIEQVAHIARLARIELTPQETEQYQTDLSAILSYVEGLQELNIDDVPPTLHLTETLVELRQDDMVQCSKEERAGMLDAFPVRKADLLAVPPVFATYKE